METIFWGIIEDDFSLRNSLEDYLFLKKYSLTFSTDNIENVLDSDYIDEPQFILLDEHLGGQSGINSIARLKKKIQDACIIVITGDATPDLVIRAVENGASGFLYKPFTLNQIEVVVNSIIETGTYLHPLSTTKLFNTIRATKEKQRKNLNKLSKKELEIVNLLVTGKSYKEIAVILKKSFHTVNYHIKNTYLKFGVNSKAELLYKLNKR